MWRLQQAIDQQFIGFGATVVNKLVDLLNRGQQPKQIKTQTSYESGAIRGRRKRQPFLFEPGQNELVDRIGNKFAMLNGRRKGHGQRAIGPMVINQLLLWSIAPLHALVDPSSQPGHLNGTQTSAFRWHEMLCVQASDIVNQAAVTTVSDDHGLS